MCLRPLFLEEDSKEFNRLFHKYMTRYVANHISLEKVIIDIDVSNLTVSIGQKPGQIFDAEEMKQFVTLVQNFKKLEDAFLNFHRAYLRYPDLQTKIFEKYDDLINAMNNTLLHEYFQKEHFVQYDVMYDELKSMIDYIDKVHMAKFFKKIDAVLASYIIKCDMTYLDFITDFSIKEKVTLPNSGSFAVLKGVVVNIQDNEELIEGDYKKLLHYSYNEVCQQFYGCPDKNDIKVDIWSEGQTFFIKGELRDSQNLLGEIGNAYYHAIYSFKPFGFNQTNQETLKEHFAKLMSKQISDLNGILYSFDMYNVSTQFNQKHYQLEAEWKPVYNHLSQVASETEKKLLAKLNTEKLCLPTKTLNDNVSDFLQFALDKIQQPFFSSVDNQDLKKKNHYAVSMKLYSDKIQELVSRSINHYYTNNWQFEQLREPYPESIAIKQGSHIIYTRFEEFQFSAKNETLKLGHSQYNTPITYRQRKDYVLNGESYYAFDLSLDPQMNKIFVSKDTDQFKLRMKAYYHHSLGLENAKLCAKADLESMKKTLSAMIDDMNVRYAPTLKAMHRIKNIQQSIAKIHLVSSNH